MRARRFPDARDCIADCLGRSTEVMPNGGAAQTVQRPGLVRERLSVATGLVTYGSLS